MKHVEFFRRQRFIDTSQKLRASLFFVFRITKVADSVTHTFLFQTWSFVVMFRPTWENSVLSVFCPAVTWCLCLSQENPELRLQKIIPPDRTFFKVVPVLQCPGSPAVLLHLFSPLYTTSFLILLHLFPPKRFILFIFSPQHQTAARAGISHVRLQSEAKCDIREQWHFPAF